MLATDTLASYGTLAMFKVLLSSVAICSCSAPLSPSPGANDNRVLRRVATVGHGAHLQGRRKHHCGGRRRI